MAQMSSEEALNGIFNILDTMVNQHEEKKKETLDENIKNATGGRRINGSLAWTRRLGGRNVAVGRYR